MLSIQTTDDGKTGAFKLLIDNEEVGIMEFHWENPILRAMRNNMKM